MRVYGIDFTSAPSRRKPITRAVCRLDGDSLRFEALDVAEDFGGFEKWLAQAESWVAGLDFPFSQSRTFVTNINWPGDWPGLIEKVSTFDRAGFVQALEAYKAPRAKGDKEHSRRFEKKIGASSPQKLYGVPVAKMFFEGAPRLLRAGVHLPGQRDGDRARTCVEAYPGVLARAMLAAAGTPGPYKAEARADQTADRADRRRALLTALCGPTGQARMGLRVEADPALCDDPSGDRLDALLCAVQAAWAHRRKLTAAGPAGADADPLEGWIADPAAEPEQ